MHKIRLSWGIQWSALYREGKRNYNFVPPMKRYRSCGKRVTDSSQAVIYHFSRLRLNRHIPCVQWEHATLPILNHIPQTFTLDASPFIETKQTVCICVMKNMIYSKRSKLDFSLVWLSIYTAYITLDVKSCAMLNWSTKMFSRWHLIA